METNNYLFYSGITTFANYKYTRELDNVDIAIMGIPFDQGTTYRSGARFGARSIRAVSNCVFAFNYLWDTEEFSLSKVCKKIIDYGDVGMFYGNRAVDVMINESYKHAKRILESGASLMSLGGDYSHANFAYDLVQEGCIDPSHSVQVCIRTNFDNCGYSIIYANEAIKMGPDALAEKIKSIVGNMPVYFTFDIDALDPAYAPGTGTPAYDHSEITAFAAAHITQDLMCLMAKNRLNHGK